jgi:putative transposase
MGKPKRSPYQKKEMPFAASRPHQYWSADVRYVKKHRLGGRIYVISILDNYSRALLASSITRSQDRTAFLSVLYSAVTTYGPPEALVTDSGSIFISNRAKRIYRALGITKYEIEKDKPWQSYLETAFNIQRRMADWHFAQGLLAGKRWSPHTTVSCSTTTSSATTPTSSERMV